MFFTRKLTSYCICLLLFVVNNQLIASEQLHPWGQMALMDLKAIQETLNGHHVGPVDPENPDYKNWLNEGYIESGKMAQSVTSFNDYVATVSHYADGFDDGHITFYTYLNSRRQAWPQFTLQHLAGKTLVVNVFDDASVDIQQGDQLISCDGKSVTQLMNERIYPYQGINGLEAETARLTPRLLVSRKNSFVKDPQTCRFARGDAEFESKLNWTRITEQDLEQKLAAGTDELSFSLKQLDKGIYRVSLPTFNVHGRHQEMEALITELTKSSAELRQASALVFDVRGNSGGSSGWAVKVIDTIFGQGMADRAHRTNFERVDWRVSKENIESLKYWQNYWQERGGENDASAKGYAKLIADMNESLANNELFFSIPAQRVKEKDYIRGDEIKPKVFLLTDNACFSACLGMADIVMSFPDAVHIGAPTRADAIYIDNRSINLPSGNGGLSFSMKVYRGRVRGHNQPYIPGIRYSGSNWSTKAMDNWFLGSVWGNNKVAVNRPGVSEQ